jgi:adenine-specific DNA-methyltransferase
MPQKYEGRLELTWTNKHLALLAHEDGSYEWVPPADYRVAEVRLLDEVEAVGAAADTRENLLIVGDALNALVSLARLPEIATTYVGKVKLAYIDPPFNTKLSFLQYRDALEHSVWLTMMRDRLVQIRGLLSAEGSVWVHCDDSEQAYLKAAMDEVFGRANFAAVIVWEKTTSGRNDYILVYARDLAKFQPRRAAHTAAADRAYKNPDNDPRGPWREVDYKGPKSAEERPNLYYPLIHPVTREEVWPRRERVWAYGREEHERHLREGLLWWGKTGNYRFPKLKKYLSERDTGGTPPRTFWSAEECDTTRRAKDEVKKLFRGKIPFATPKPERLMAKIIELASEPGDIVLDCFAGSGTTAAVAHKLGRRWVTSEREADTVVTYTRPRLEAVVAGADPGGITESAGWDGGGGFRVVQVGPSMFVDEGGVVVLATWADNGALARATAAQLGFTFEPAPPFCGRRGRARLAVVDGLVNAAVVGLLAEALPDDERLVVCASAVDPEAVDHASRLRPGTRVRKIPDSLLHEFRRRAAAEVPPAPAAPAAPAAATGAAQ